MEMKKTSKGMMLAAAVATLWMTGATSSFAADAPKADDPIVDCQGLNACKGHGSCQTADNACKGQNSCKGKGVISAYKSECEAAKGKAVSVDADKPALVACKGITEGVIHTKAEECTENKGTVVK